MKTSVSKIFNQRLCYPLAALISCALPAHAQDSSESDKDIFELSPFVVTESEAIGYQATTTLAGTRIKTNLSDIATTVSVATKEFLDDTASTDAKDLLVYMAGTEVGGTGGNFTNARSTSGVASDEINIRSGGQGNRIRGLASGDLARNYFSTAIPFDSYNTQRVEVNRGSNAVLFGLGSPAGIINNATQTADFYDSTMLELSIDKFGSYRGVLNTNQNLIENELAIRVAAVLDRESYEQKPAYEDTDRYYLAVTYRKDLLPDNQFWGATTIRGNYETGNIDSNLPRTTPPMDLVSPWFQPYTTDVLGQVNISPKPAWDAYRGAVVGSGDIAKYGAAPVGSSSEPLYDNPALFFGVSNTFQEGPALIFEGENNFFPSDPAGGNIIGRQGIILNVMADRFGDSRTGTLNHAFFAVPAPLTDALGSWRGTVSNPEAIDYGQLFAPAVVTDPTIFNFRKILIDGPNKSEGQDFDVKNVTFEQMLLDGRAGFELAYSKESYEQSWTALQPTRLGVGLTIDVNAVLPDGTENPNFGRPFMLGAFAGGGKSSNERESKRFTGFYDLDFTNRDGLTKWLGRHVLTGLVSEYEENNYSFSFNPTWDMTMVYGLGIDPTQTNARGVASVHYLGGTLKDRSTPSGANIPGLQVNQIPSTTKYANGPSNVLVHRNRSSANGSQLPKGFQELSFSLDDEFIYGGSVSRNVFDAKAFVLQSFLLDDNIVATYSRRNDKIDVRTNSSPTILEDRSAVVDPSVFNVDSITGDAVLSDDKTTTTWGVVAKVPQGLLKHINFISGLQFHYGESSNFQPSGRRFNEYYQIIPSPTGETKDYGFTLSLMDNKFILKSTWYETSQSNISATAVDRNWVPQWSAFLLRETYNNAFRDIKDGVQGSPFLGYVSGTERIRVDSNGDGQEDFILPQMPQFFVDTYDIVLDPENGYGFRDPGGFSHIESVESKGLEIEVVYNPTGNWRIILNATKQEAVRGGAGVDYVKWQTEAPFWDSDGDGTPDLSFRDGMIGPYSETPWRSIDFGELQTGRYDVWMSALTTTNGTRSPELAKWAGNLITNYEFSDGKLDGLRIGGAIRYRQAAAIGYGITTNPDTGGSIPDVNNVILGEDFWRVEAWVGYSMPVFKNKATWDIQLNVRNLLNDSDLIPVQANPDGTFVGYRIPVPLTFELRSSLTF